MRKEKIIINHWEVIEQVIYSSYLLSVLIDHKKIIVIILLFLNSMHIIKTCSNETCFITSVYGSYRYAEKFWKYFLA